MKIADVKAFPVRAGLRNLLIVKVESDDGHHGWGESGVVGRELAVEGAVRHFREFLIGKDPRRIGALWQEMYRGQYFEGGRILTGAISAIDIALHDLVARSLGVPVYQLLGGAHRDFVPCFTTSGARWAPKLCGTLGVWSTWAGRPSASVGAPTTRAATSCCSSPGSRCRSPPSG